MRNVFIAFARALKSLCAPAVLWHLVWPGLAACVLWTGVAYFVWDIAVQVIGTWLKSWSWIQGFFGHNPGMWRLVEWFISVNLLLLTLLLTYATAIFILAAWALPVILERVSKSTYGDLECRQGGSISGSVLNTVWTASLFVFMLFCSLPFWLLPGAGVIALVLLTAWLNVRTFGYDALMLHADRDERRAILKTEGGTLMLLGSLCALTAYVPFVNVVSAPICGLVFTHYLLEALRRKRQADSPESLNI